MTGRRGGRRARETAAPAAAWRPCGILGTKGRPWAASGRRAARASESRFRDAPYGHRQLATWAAAVRRDLAYWQARNTPVHSVVVRHDGSCVQLGTPVVDAVRARVGSRYPAMPVCVVADGPGWAATAQPR